jgi:serine/threonine protein kinase
MLSVNAALQQNRYRVIQPFEAESDKVEIYKAFDETEKREVILKEVTELGIEPEKILNLKHEALQKVFDIFQEGNKTYLVMEVVDGDSLAQLIERNKRPFPLTDVANWANELLDALIYLHSHIPPIIHLNISPQNIRLAINGKVKLDISEIGVCPKAKVGATITNQNLHFLPFEVIFEQLDSASQKVLLSVYDDKSADILKQPADTKSDLYSLGATLYYLLTARFPIDPLERSIEMLEDKPDPLIPAHQHNPKLPPEISEAIAKAMEIRRENRFDSAAIMRQFLKTAFVRIKEREKTGDLVEITGAEFGDDILELESEPVPVVDLMRKLQEAEAKRLEAEKRAAEAEKKLTTLQTTTAELGGSISYDELENQGFAKWKIAAAAGTLVFLIIIGLGVRSLLDSSVDAGSASKNQISSEIKTDMQQQQATQPSSPVTETKEPTQSKTEKEVATKKNVERTEKPVPEQRQQVEKKQKESNETQQKKKITVDDLISDQ